MTVNMNSLYTNPITRGIARKSRKLTVILSTGKKVSFDKKNTCTKKEDDMSETERKEYESAMMMIRF